MWIYKEDKIFIFYLFFLTLKTFFSHIFTWAYTAISPTCTPPSLSLPNPPLLPGRNCSALFSNFVEDKR
jgi:hypothetical protein